MRPKAVAQLSHVSQGQQAPHREARGLAEVQASTRCHVASLDQVFELGPDGHGLGQLLHVRLVLHDGRQTDNEVLLGGHRQQMG